VAEIIPDRSTQFVSAGREENDALAEVVVAAVLLLYLRYRRGKKIVEAAG